MKTMLSKLSALLKNHFNYQQHVINQSMKPFLPKIATAEKLHNESMAKFLKQRENQKDEVKSSTAL